VSWDTVVHDDDGFYAAGAPTVLTVPDGWDGTFVLWVSADMQQASQRLRVMVNGNQSAITTGSSLSCTGPVGCWCSHFYRYLPEFWRCRNGSDIGSVWCDPFGGFVSDVANEAINDLAVQLGDALAHLAVARAHIRDLRGQLESVGSSEAVEPV